MDSLHHSDSRHISSRVKLTQIIHINIALITYGQTSPYEFSYKIYSLFFVRLTSPCSPPPFDNARAHTHKCTIHATGNSHPSCCKTLHQRHHRRDIFFFKEYYTYTLPHHLILEDSNLGDLNFYRAFKNEWVGRWYLSSSLMDCIVKIPMMNVDRIDCYWRIARPLTQFEKTNQKQKQSQSQSNQRSVLKSGLLCCHPTITNPQWLTFGHCINSCLRIRLGHEWEGSSLTSRSRVRKHRSNQSFDEWLFFMTSVKRWRWIRKTVITIPMRWMWGMSESHGESSGGRVKIIWVLQTLFFSSRTWS